MALIQSLYGLLMSFSRSGKFGGKWHFTFSGDGLEIHEDGHQIICTKKGEKSEYRSKWEAK